MGQKREGDAEGIECKTHLNTLEIACFILFKIMTKPTTKMSIITILLSHNAIGCKQVYPFDDTSSNLIMARGKIAVLNSCHSALHPEDVTSYFAVKQMPETNLYYMSSG